MKSYSMNATIELLPLKKIGDFYLIKILLNINMDKIIILKKFL